MYRKTYAEINLDYLRSNVEAVRETYPDYDYYFGVIKGNAYGHGMEVADALVRGGINYLAAATLDECLQIRKLHLSVPILCFEPIHPEDIRICAEKNITITLVSADFFEHVKNTSLSNELKIHLKLDVGMNRLGIKESEGLAQLVKEIQQTKLCALEGIYTHFSTSGFRDTAYVKQAERFRAMLQDIDLTQIPIIHSFRSAVLIRQPKIDLCNGVRVGILIYGYNQDIVIPNSIKRSIKKILRREPAYLPGQKLPLRPAFSLYSEILQVQKVRAGEHVGYGFSFQAAQDMLIGTIAIGHADGIDKTAGGYVLINDRKYPMVGLVGMDMIAIRVDDTVRVGDQATLIGDGLSATELAKRLETTPYVLFNRITGRVPRIYVQGKDS